METIDVLRFWVLQIFFWSSGAVFAYSLERREQFRKRAIVFGGIVILYSIVFWFLLWDGSVEIEYLCRFISMIIMVAFLYYEWECKFTVALYNAIWAIAIWQIVSEVWSVIEFMGAEYFAENPYMIIVGMILLFSASHILVGTTIGKWMPMDRKDVIGPRQTVSAILLFLIIEVLAFSQELRHVSEYSSEWKFLYISQMLCIVILYLQNELFKKSAMRQELALMNLLWKNKQEQYEISRENINLINQKTHDLKHQIQAIRRLSKEEFNAYLDEMESNVQLYEAIVHTGNDVLDTILTEKSLYCKDRGILVSCVADGSQMDFIEKIDLYAILGNAMDNAIEAVEKFGEMEKRQIDVMIYKQMNFLVMNFINPVEKKLIYDEENMPVTTKGDKSYHGFGLRSIRHFVKKYDGHLNISEEDGCFSLKIMIPIP